MLIYQLPAKPAYLRVKIHRRLKVLGAVAVKNAVNVLPDRESTREDFQWLKKEIDEGGGEAMIIHANLISGITNESVVSQFNDIRSDDYFSLAEEIGNELKIFTEEKESINNMSAARKFRSRFDDIIELDFFDANGRETVNGLLSQLESFYKQNKAGEVRQSNLQFDQFLNRTWVTRRGVKVDRIASAWLIKRFIDVNAQFKFVSSTGYLPEEGELRFDMFEAEYTHQGDQCTFEVLLIATQLSDTALRAIGEIIHDLDIKDAKFGRMENAGVKSLIEGICLSSDDDAQRISRGSSAFDDLYLYFQQVTS